MKKNVFFSFWLLLSLCTTAVFLSSFDKSSTPESVIINGVRWATCNVDQPGTFAASPEAPGMLYRWNDKNAWPATGKVGMRKLANTPTLSGDPSPAGYRVPTLDEIKSLLDESKVTNKWTTVNGVNGFKFTDKATGASIFLPAVGYLLTSGGIRYDGTHGYYWSSKSASVFRLAHYFGLAHYLGFSGSDADWNLFPQKCGFSVRPVAE
jgi:uncharacterized protein (TIGR02145 family)